MGVFDATQWLVFVTASIALVAVPGPAALFIVARSVDCGRRTGVVTAAGICLGNLIHAVAAAFGVSAVIASTDGALDAVRYSGAAYLIYLGLRGLLAKPKSELAADGAARGRGKGSDFGKGILVALLNPKVVLFLLAFLPQFVEAEKGPVWAQLLTLGVVFVAIGWAGDTAWALLSGTVAKRMRKKGSPRWVRVLPSVVYVALGLATAFLGK